MKSVYAKRQHGAALLAMLVVLALGASWYLVSRLNADSGVAAATRNVRNAEVLNRAKQALIGYVAMQAAEAGERNPGRLPCPEAAGYYGDPAQEGTASGNCTLPAVGRLPWRTLGLDKLMDAAGEPLWYVVSRDWALSNSTTPPLTTYLNSNSAGQLLVNARSVSALSQSAGLATVVSTAHGFRTGDIVKIAGAVPAGYNLAASVTVSNANTFTYSVDSALSTSATGAIKAGDAAVALIVAPGPAMNVAASADCAARNQTRSVLEALDYLECYDAANSVFTMTGPAASFNDQVLLVSAGELIPGIEAAIAKRIESEIVPVLKSVYADPSWSTSSSNPVFPFAVSFVNPGTSTFLGSSGESQGLLPVFTAATDPTRVVWYRSSETYPPSASKIGGAGSLSGTPDCSATSTTTVRCSVKYTGVVSIQVTAAARRVARTLRQLNAAAVPLDWADPLNPALSVSAAFITSSTSGAAYVYVRANLPDAALETTTAVTVPIGVLADHLLIDPNNPTTEWFVRNNWHHVLYYSFAPNFASNQTRFCDPPPNAEPCLSVTNVTPAGAQRAILILAGRSINGSARPSATLGDYLEFGNATAAFERRTISASNAIAPAQRFNDRIVVIDSN